MNFVATGIAIRGGAAHRQQPRLLGRHPDQIGKKPVTASRRQTARRDQKFEQISSHIFLGPPGTPIRLQRKKRMRLGRHRRFGSAQVRWILLHTSPLT